jgi:hypothetical protein
MPPELGLECPPQRVQIQTGQWGWPPIPDTVADVVFGVIWYRLLAGRGPFGDQLAGEIASTLSASDGNVPAA